MSTLSFDIENNLQYKNAKYSGVISGFPSFSIIKSCSIFSFVDSSPILSASVISLFNPNLGF